MITAQTIITVVILYLVIINVVGYVIMGRTVIERT